MRRLILLRHAKAHRDDPAGDRARALTDRGRADAAAAGAWMRDHAIAPDVALVSDARRARETMERLLPALVRPPHMRVEPRLYLADPATLLRAIRATPADARVALVVGHNPGIAELALALAGEGVAEAVGRLAHAFPTASLAVLAFDGEWGDLGERDGRLERFVTARAAHDRTAER
ncbi:MAG: SixA phosphatase family protein [Beijerinckiaceae bacterium]|jgi:phosphohistidine phosphatase